MSTLRNIDWTKLGKVDFGRAAESSHSYYAHTQRLYIPLCGIFFQCIFLTIRFLRNFMQVGLPKTQNRFLGFYIGNFKMSGYNLNFATYFSS